MSGIVAAAQSGGCCCTPQVSYGCRQTEAVPYLQSVDDFDELSIEVQASFMSSTVYLIDCAGNCAGASITTQWSTSGALVDKEAGGLSWRTRMPVTAGSGSQSVGVCRSGLLCCTRPCWDTTNTTCFPNQQGGGEASYICLCVQEGTTLIAPPLRCNGDFSERTETVCAQCAPNNPINYYNQWNVRSQIVRLVARIQFVCDFQARPCGPDPADGTFCRFELSISASTVLQCPDGEIGGFGGEIVYVKTCCNYADGPLGTYILRDDMSSGNYSSSDGCFARTQTLQASQIAIVRRA